MPTRGFCNFSKSAPVKISKTVAMFKRFFSHSNQPFSIDTLIGGVTFCFLTVLSASSSFAMAEGLAGTPKLASSSAKPPNPASPPKATQTLKISSKPAWQDLTPAQQLSLKPLAANWSTMAQAQKRKWIALAASYSTLSPAEQTKLHSRMTEWASLSQQERAQARLSFSKSKQLSPTQKAATWQAYQALSPEEKKKLAISAPPKPAGAAKSIHPQKLASIPVPKKSPKQTSNVAASTQTVDRNTLLPRLAPSPEAPPQQKN